MTCRSSSDRRWMDTFELSEMPPASAWLKQRLGNPFGSLPESSDSSGKTLLTLKWLPGGWRKSKSCQTQKQASPWEFQSTLRSKLICLNVSGTSLSLPAKLSEPCVFTIQQSAPASTHTQHCGALECTSYLTSCPAIVCHCHWATKHESTSHSACSSQS